MITLLKDNLNDFIKNISDIETMKFKEITNGKIFFMENIAYDEYLIISLNNKTKKIMDLF